MCDQVKDKQNITAHCLLDGQCAIQSNGTVWFHYQCGAELVYHCAP